MSLPTLPNPAYHIVSQGELIGYMSAEQMQAYGQACREAALEEAAVALETGDVSGLKDDAHLLAYTTYLLVSFAKYFRGLK